MVHSLPKPDWRATRKAETFRRIQEEAIRLFLERGFENTTIEEIANAAGVSSMTVFRHFPNKEALVILDEYDDLIPDLLRTAYPEKDPIPAFRQIIRDIFAKLDTPGRDLALNRARLIRSTPALNGGLWAHWLWSQEAMVHALLERVDVPPTLDVFRLRVQVAAIAGAAVTAMSEWASMQRQTDETNLGDLGSLIDEALAILNDPISAGWSETVSE